MSWAASAEVGYQNALGSVSVKVSAAGDTERSSLLESTGASDTKSKVYTSIGELSDFLLALALSCDTVEILRLFLAYIFQFRGTSHG